MNAEQLKQLENNLWSAADNLRANSGLRASDYATPILGLIFLKFADNKYSLAEPGIQAEFESLKGGRREKPLHDIAIQHCGFFLPPNARYQHLLSLSLQDDIAHAIRNAMECIERYKPELEGVLPKDEYYQLVPDGDQTLLSELLKTFSDIPVDVSGDVLGKIYEYFLGKFALAEGQGGGEFFTPTSVVRLMVEIIEPHNGKVFDPACGSGGMFVQSQMFVERRREELNARGAADDTSSFYVYGQEKTPTTSKLAKMNLAVNGLRGEIHTVNSYKQDPVASLGKFDYVMANPPFNVDDVPLADVKDQKRFNEYGIPQKKTKAKKSEQGKETVPNANYLWINLFATSLNEKGRAALVMANSASDARHSEADIRQTLIENNLIDGMLTLPSNMFYTVTLPATLWFFNKAKTDQHILFIDARNIFTQIDRAHREFSEEQVQNIAIISRLRRGDRLAFVRLIQRYFEQGMEQLAHNHQQVAPVSQQLNAVMNKALIEAAQKPAPKNTETSGSSDDNNGEPADIPQHPAVTALLAQWQQLGQLQQAWKHYQQATAATLNQAEHTDAVNQQQQQLQAHFEPFFKQLHNGLKQLDKTVRAQEKADREAKEAEAQIVADAESRKTGKTVTPKRVQADRDIKQLKHTLETLHQEVKDAERYFGHIHWLQERFPQARYEDVTGLCKLASLDEIKEQDYSLNPGRYVGVVIEEDGKTEEEFVSEMFDYHKQLNSLTQESKEITLVINKNVSSLIGDL